MVDGFSDNDRVKMAESSEKHEFQAEVNRLMDIIINSLYTEAGRGRCGVDSRIAGTRNTM